MALTIAFVVELWRDLKESAQTRETNPEEPVVQEPKEGVGTTGASAQEPVVREPTRPKPSDAESGTSDERASPAYRFGAALGALFVRTKRSLRKDVAPGTATRPETTGAQKGRQESPLPGGDRPLDCAACGAGNPPGSEYCGECGAALPGAEA